MLSPAATQRLAPVLRRLQATFDHQRRKAIDPVEFPHRFRRREDIEVAALISTSLAYGRVDLFRPKLETLFAAMGPSPADFAAGFDPRRHSKAFAGFCYRFNVPADLAVLTAGAGSLLRQAGTLEVGLKPSVPLQESLSAFAKAIRGAPRKGIEAALGPVRGLDHLLPEPTRGSTSKRLLLFLRWMVRGPDEVDFGLWKTVSPSELVIPLDTHIARMSRHLGLTERTDLSWRTAMDITDSLRTIDPADPVRFDFALCHFGMSGACPLRSSRSVCLACPLLAACRTGQRLTRRKLEKGRVAS